MKLIIAFFRLVRSLNLAFIVLTQFLFRYCIVLPAYASQGLSPRLSNSLFLLLVISSVFIAAAGYVINDYFDLNIDRVNKPGKLVVDKIIGRRFAILWHLGLSFVGVVLSFYVGWKAGSLFIGFANSGCVFLLWFYSTTFKKNLLIGNFIISLLTSWTVLVLYVAEIPQLPFPPVDSGVLQVVKRIFKLAALYGGFAFIISLIREVIKDIEDMTGDAKYGCRTMPIIWGLNVSKVFIATWLIVLISMLVIVQLYVFPFRWFGLMGYCIAFIIVPLLYIFRKLFEANSSGDFHRLSSLVKFTMAMGIISMIFFKIYL
jgi:4-hydroxybenzoate polyprenyltransferase